MDMLKIPVRKKLITGNDDQRVVKQSAEGISNRQQRHELQAEVTATFT